MHKPVVVLGSGLAGYTLIREIRKQDPNVAITLISRDSGDFYSKPMLSNALAQGKSAEALVVTSATKMAETLGFTLLHHADVVSIDRARKHLLLATGELEYERLVLAVGADPIRLPLQGDAANELMSINDLDDYARFRSALVSAKRVAIIGSGLIGCEFANDLAAAGYAVTVMDPAAYPLSGLLPEQAGMKLIEPLAKLGVVWRFGAAVTAIQRDAARYLLTLSDGSAVSADVVLSAIGLRPRTELARHAGLSVNRGIVVDAQLRTSDPDIYALGDCAEIDGKTLPYVLPIMHAARVLARVLAGDNARVEFPPMPVVVKTPAHPIAVQPVARDAKGGWKVLSQGAGLKLGFFDVQDKLCGFAITGEFAGERSEMVKQLSTN